MIELDRPSMPEPLPRSFADATNVLFRHLREWPIDQDPGICKICRVPMPCTYRRVAANIIGGRR